MSPETMTRNIYSTKTDIWSLGVLFYELLYGSPPWKSTTEQDLLKEILNIEVTYPPNQRISEESKDVINKAL
jgi:serine/threonine protein kinase